MPLVGSSRKTTEGQPMKAMATLSLRRWPPDRSPAATRSFSARPAQHAVVGKQSTSMTDIRASRLHTGLLAWIWQAVKD